MLNICSIFPSLLWKIRCYHPVMQLRDASLMWPCTINRLYGKCYRNSRLRGSAGYHTVFLWSIFPLHRPLTVRSLSVTSICHHLQLYLTSHELFPRHRATGVWLQPWNVKVAQGVKRFWAVQAEMWANHQPRLSGQAARSQTWITFSPSAGC